MQLVCPSCHTAFHVDPTALGADGRAVRCARCRTTWFARPADLMPAPVMAEASVEGDSPPGMANDVPAISDAAPADAMPAASAVSAVPLPQVVPWNDTVMVEVNPSPPLVPAADAAGMQGAEPAKSSAPSWTIRKRRKPTKKSPAQIGLIAATIVLAAIVVAAIGSRASLVRAEPDLAGLYAAIGLPVNLRGLEFNEIKTTHEVQDGIPVLVIEGEIVNVTRQAVEVPRLRLAVIGADERELYSWTALLPRSVLSEGESLPFRSRLASPPAEGKEVVVRFLNRVDLTANGR